MSEFCKYKTVKFNRVLLPASMLLLIIACTTESPQQLIVVNLVGFHPDQVKQALLVNTFADEFDILRLDTMEVVYSGSVGREKSADLATGDWVSILDFTDFKTRGEYFIQVADKNRKLLQSGSFRISDDVYREIAQTSLQSFYYQRCGTSVQKHKLWSHNICHKDDARFYYDPSIKIDVTGGWHSAGSYNKSSVNTAFSCGLLLYLYEANPEAFYDGQLKIPEASNGIPDILDEASWGLRWLLKMQNHDGGVFHKVAQKDWDGESLPGEDHSQSRYIFEISTTATAGFSAVTAIGARLLEEFDPVFSKQLADASIKAWEYLKRNPVVQPLGGFVNPPGVQGGAFWDNKDTDERQWASIELYKLTHDETLLEDFSKNFNPQRGERLPVLSWQNVQMFALYSFLNTEMPEKYNRFQTELLDFLILNANAVLRKQADNNYKNLIGHTEYYYGSNSVGLGYAYELIQIYKVTGEKKYQQAALDQLHFVLGRNPLGISMVTGVGSRSVQYPYHELSKFDDSKEPIPGMLVGGPNNNTHLRRYYIYRVISEYPAKNYEDTYENYLVNEVAINFTAVFLYAAGINIAPPNI